MHVIKAEFVISAAAAKQFPEDNLPEFSLAGRSNVGKSSLINAMLNRKKIARTSSTPGKTGLINFYRVNDLFYFADVPGYGYAKVPKSIRQSWDKLMYSYLVGRENIRTVILVVDSRHVPSTLDCQMYDFCKEHSLRVLVVATKLDKISKNQRQKNLSVIRKTLKLDSEDKLLTFSTLDKSGIEELWSELESLL